MPAAHAEAARSCAASGETLALARLVRAGSQPGGAGLGAIEHLRSCGVCRVQYRAALGEILPRIPHYTLIRPLGSGGFGQVYQAIHHDKERVEAIKLATRRSERGTANLANEVHLAASLRHPHIATLYDAKLDSDPPYYAMEYVPGENLDDYLSQKPHSLADALKIFEKIAVAVHYAHERGVIHRDLKPRNILVSADDEPRVVDFGIGRQLPLAAPPGAGGAAGKTDTGDSAAGTPGYMAPEQIFGHSSDARSDVYSLGVILLNSLLSTTEVPEIRVLRHRFAEREFPRAGDLAAIVAKCTQTDPGQRYASAAEVAADMRAYLRGEPVAARGDAGPRYRARRALTALVQNQPRSMAFALCVALFSAFCALFWATRARHVATAAGGAGRAPVVLAAFDEATRAAIGAGEFQTIAPDARGGDRFSWRWLHAALTRAIGEAGASAITWDYFFPRCHEATDAAFAAALSSGPAAVVGAAEFDAAARPAICGALRDAVAGVGCIQGPLPSDSERDIAVTLAIRRGNAPPIPSLALATLGAARFVGYRPHYAFVPNGVEIRYESKKPSGDQPVWHAHSDFIPATEVHRATIARGLAQNDQTVVTRMPIAAVRSAQWVERRSYADLLKMPASERAALLKDRAVLIGQTEPGTDQWPWPDGGHVFGCEIQAAALASLLTRQFAFRYLPSEIALRVGIGLLLGAFLARWAGPRRGYPWTALPTLVGALVLAQLGGLVSLRFASGWLVGSTLVVTPFLVAFLVLRALAAYRRRVSGAATLLRAFDERGATLSDRLVRSTSTLAHRPTPDRDQAPIDSR